ncbi:MAG: hypothetical protein UR96_C0019G0015 [candidate division WS6 bacterium GW2011_GWC1_36_11]|uniref:Uncharacterized protein n=1 Tax=candidate division WS6 bacterium GW2011_GWC1_36_11 TaxID=1619090 RepID=A0A0G0DT31_9BACT|nr:MAG: hypothetical protein UR96_C0019G0015 [candidate division WS6 bacterium GW2011_GWC1_36_11]
MNNDVNNMLDNLGKNPLGGLSVNVATLLKFPLVLILFGNVLWTLIFTKRFF